MLDEKYQTLLKQGASSFGINLDQEQINKFLVYAKLLVEWNDKINLTAITDAEGIVIKHFLDSLSLLPLLPDDSRKVIDVGTGAGFPGVPLKVCSDRLTITLLDSLEKRVKFLNELCTNMELTDITAVHGRAEDFGSDKKYREQFDVATARAVANLPVLMEYCLPFVKVGGIFAAMKGPDAKEELKESKKALEVLGGEVLDVKSFTLPQTDYERCILLIKKCRHTPSGYPRKSGKPTKLPIK